MKRSTAVPLLTILAVLAGAPAFAKEVPTGTTLTAGTSPTGAQIEVGSGSGAPSRPEPNGAPKPPPYEGCTRTFGYLDIAPFLHLLDSQNGPRPEGTEVLFCDETSTGNRVALLVGQDSAAAAALVAQSAFATLTISAPEAQTAPRPDGLLLAGLRTWFWDAGTDTLTATATIPGLSATVTATPTGTTVATDDTTLTCPDGGTPYDPTRPGTDQDHTCTHIYATSGTHTATITTTWAITWTATNGTTGTLPNLTRTTTLTLDITAAEATTD